MRRGAIKGILISVPTFLFCMLIVAGIFGRTGERVTDDEFRRGARVTDKRSLVQGELARKGKMGALSIAGLRLPAKYEVAHQLFLGGPGTGKTVLINRQLEEIREAGRRAVVYDVTGTFVERWYRPDHDIILNPLDDRSPAWRVWNDIRHSADFEHYANVIVPDGDDAHSFWAKAAQITLRSVMRKLAETKKDPTNADLLQFLTRMDLEAFQTWLQGTDAMALLEKEAAKMSASIRATINANLTGFSYLGDEGERFSIKDVILQPMTHPD